MPLPTPGLRRLHPGPPEQTTIDDAYRVRRARPAGESPIGRPWVTVCMIASLDGAVTMNGTSGGLGNPNDLAVLVTLRDVADVIVVGAGTARGEGYGPPRKLGQRVGVVTNSGSVDLDQPLFTSGAGFVITSRSAAIDESAVDVIRAGDGRVDLVAAFDSLTTLVAGVSHVQVEGGPTLNAGLVAVDLVDELALTLSPRMVGNDGPRLTQHAPAVDARYELAHLLLDEESFVFGRWLRRRAGGDQEAG